jgi:hypothetical protein
MDLRRAVSLAVKMGLATALIAASATCASAQEKIIWSDMDCSQSRLVIPARLKCRETNLFGTRGAPTSTGGGQVKAWSASGILQQAKLYYYVIEAVDTQSGVQVGRLGDDVRIISPQARAVGEMSGIERKGAAAVVTFVNTAKDDCVGIRKYGPNRSGGYRWVLYATRCTPAGRKASSADNNAFIADACFRQ